MINLTCFIYSQREWRTSIYFDSSPHFTIKRFDQSGSVFIFLFRMTQPSVATETPSENPFLRIDCNLTQGYEKTLTDTSLSWYQIKLTRRTVWLAPQATPVIFTSVIGNTCPLLVFSVQRGIRNAVKTLSYASLFPDTKYFPSVLFPDKITVWMKKTSKSKEIWKFISFRVTVTLHRKAKTLKNQLYATYRVGHIRGIRMSGPIHRCQQPCWTLHRTKYLRLVFHGRQVE